MRRSEFKSPSENVLVRLWEFEAAQNKKAASNFRRPMVSLLFSADIAKATAFPALQRYIFTGVACDAIHCHLPLAIFIHVSVHRSSLSNGLPDSSVPLPLKLPVAMAVFP